jgi:hypothetical protein
MKEHTVITESQPVPVFGRDGEPCPACGAPLAGDQRYCLHCGGRRPEARLEFLDVLDADVHARSAPPVAPAAFPSGAASAAPAPRGLNGRLQANAGLLALAALLSLTLLIGLLLGHWATGDPPGPGAAAPAPQVIRLEGTAPATANTGSGADTSGAGASGGAAGSSAASKSTKSSAKTAGSATKATAPKGSVSVDKLASKKAVDDAVKKGKPISTGTGTLPPKDNKPAGGGSGFQEIG